jgi:hypothetical protein
MFGMMEAMLGFLRRQVGLRTDSASASGSLHAKINRIYENVLAVPHETMVYCAVPSGTLRASADVERTVGGNWRKIKEILVFIDGWIRVSFEGTYTSSSSPSGGAGRIYVNGVAIGAERSFPKDVWQTYTEDIHVSKGDLVQIYASADSSTTRIRNFRLYWDYNTINEAQIKQD